MNPEVFKNISKIIEQDSKTTTYKFALLRGVIDIIQDNSPYIQLSPNVATIPLGLLIEKWLLYYYPILESKSYIPQINGDAQLAFSRDFVALIHAYETRGGFSSFYNDLKNKGIPTDLQDQFASLAKSIGKTIVQMPMRYIGRSISSEYYSIFTYQKRSPTSSQSLSDSESLVRKFGHFSLPLDYYEGFKLFGSFISGSDSILFKWAQFSANASGSSLSSEVILHEVLKSPITERNIAESKNIFKKVLNERGRVECVWTGRPIRTYDIDHLIPFSIWKNNDLWNLMPAEPKVNQTKRDKIPAPELIERQKGAITYYWRMMRETNTTRFEKEVRNALLGPHALASLDETGIDQLKDRCRYLIEVRGFPCWSGPH